MVGEPRWSILIVVFAQLNGKALNLFCQPLVILLQLLDLLLLFAYLCLLLQDYFHGLIQGRDFHLLVAIPINKAKIYDGAGGFLSAYLSRRGKTKCRFSRIAFKS